MSLKYKILKLRSEGKSYNEIVEELECSKSTVSHHCIKEGVNDIGLAPRMVEYTKCKNCGIKFLIKRDKPNQKYCSHKCCTTCPEWLEKCSINGRKGVESQKNNKRSKNEIYFAELCDKYFDKVLTNEAIFNTWDADVIIEDYKVAILWNGRWHYEKITENHSVKQVQNRDRIKVKEIKKAGYVPYIIKDMGRENKNFVEKEFEKLTRCISSLS